MTKSVARVTILDTDTAPTIVVGDGILKEGDAGGTARMVFPVLLSTASTTPITVTYGTSDGTAIAGTDYTATNGSIVIPAGATSAQITVPVLGNQIQQNNRTFKLNLTGRFSRSEQQTLILSNSGNLNANVTLGFLGEVTTSPLFLGTLPSAAAVRANLQTIPSLAGNISVTSPTPGTYLVTFNNGTGRNALAGWMFPPSSSPEPAQAAPARSRTVKGGNSVDRRSRARAYRPYRRR